MAPVSGPGGGYMSADSRWDTLDNRITLGWPRNGQKTGTFHTKLNDSTDPEEFSVWYWSGQYFYYPDNSQTQINNTLIISHIDPASNIISGTFQFTLYRQSGGTLHKSDSVVVTDGRFDVKY